MTDYCTLEELKAELGISDTAADEMLQLAVSAASRQIDSHTGRTFDTTATAAARTFRADDSGWLYVGDFWSTDDLVVKIDADADGTFETTITAADYELGVSSDISKGFPYSEIVMVGDYRFPQARRSGVQVTAKWGWASLPDDVQKACRVQAAQLFKAKDTAFGVAGFAEFGVLRVQARMNPIAAALLAGYRKPAIG